MPRYPSLKQDKNTEALPYFRLNVLIGAVVFLSLLLFIRLFYLQVIEFKRYETLSLKNQISVIPIAPPRGIILDRNGVVLAENIPVYVLELIPEHIKNMADTLKRLSALIPSISKEDKAQFFRAYKQNRSFMPIPLKLKLNQEEVALFATHQHQFPGVSIKARLMRYYPLKEITAHVLGFVGRINVHELKNVDATNYRATNFMGKTGIEKYYESILHGQVGYQEIETDVSGRTVRTLNKIAPLAGKKLFLTIDTRLQQKAYDALKDKKGAIVVMDTQNGDVLAMVSTPSFDPNLFVNGISHKDYQNLANTKERPLFNRAVRGLYPPASTIKPFIALSGLDKGIIDNQYAIFDPGFYKLPNVSHSYRDWKRTGHGFINLKRAITVSCDTYFYQLGHRLGIEQIESTLRQFGFGQLTQIDLVEEAQGLVPNNQWKRKNRGLSWYPGDTLITAIGQGFMLASPLQLANATVALTQQGKRFRPHLLFKSMNSEGLLSFYKPLEEYPVLLKNKEHWALVADAMVSVIQGSEGTAASRFGRNAPYSVAGKTGTAQVFSLPQQEKQHNLQIPDYLKDHSLFIAYMPVEKPEVTIAVLVENDSIAPIIARQVLDAYYALKTSDEPK